MKHLGENRHVADSTKKNQHNTSAVDAVQCQANASLGPCLVGGLNHG